MVYQRFDEVMFKVGSEWYFGTIEKFNKNSAIVLANINVRFLIPISELYKSEVH